MAFAQKATVILLLVMVSLDFSMTAVYKVGDSTGWTTLGNYNYTAWALSKTFRVGDIIVFEYHKDRHNVLRVTQPNFQACNASFPQVTYNSGNDSILINKTGHHYFICGFPGHCPIGQKVDIHIPNKSSVATAPFGSPVASPTPKSSAPYPSKGLLGNLGMAVLALCFCVSVFVYY
ncbi:mavicyanin-like [Macadamia integrifolia]|uniref:mavicyanin-like n=1 Tax=Macadamia integrifolia TaxID=60698 RepID=UPI001C4FE8AE|nr:mavicyanin-like [Macadamia integrifolia]